MPELGTHSRAALQHCPHVGFFSSHLSFLWRQVKLHGRVEQTSMEGLRSQGKLTIQFVNASQVRVAKTKVVGVSLCTVKRPWGMWTAKVGEGAI
jgi:hypothetical protein